MYAYTHPIKTNIYTSWRENVHRSKLVEQTVAYCIRQTSLSHLSLHRFSKRFAGLAVDTKQLTLPLLAHGSRRGYFTKLNVRLGH